MEWAILTLVQTVIFAFSLALNTKQIIESIFGSFSDYVTDKLYKFGSLFLFGFIICIGAYCLTTVCTYCAVKFIFKKNVSINRVLNLVATASLPLTVAFILNMIAGFIWVPFIVIFSTIGMLATAVLLYVGIQRLEKLDKSPFGIYILIWTVVVAALVIVTKMTVENYVSGLFSSIRNFF